MDAYQVSSLRNRGKSIVEDLKLSINLNGCYGDIFAQIREVGKDRTRELFRRFYGGDMHEEYFPNGNELGEYLYRVTFTEWFKPKRVFSPEDISDKISEITNALKIGAKETKIINDLLVNRDSAWGAAMDAAWGAARDSAWGAAMDAAWGAARDAARNAAWGTARDAAMGAGYIIVKDINKLKERYPINPFEKLLKIYELGLCPIGIHNNDFVIWHPPVEASV